MSRTYKATGINLKSMPLGETDRLLTILTREFGLIQAVAPGARKHHSKLGGRSELFVVNELLIASGRSLDKITQAETVQTYPKLGDNLLKLTASQYLAELILCHALSEQPQEELFCLLTEHLRRIEQIPKLTVNRSLVVLAYLTHAVFHTLALAGIAPQLRLCCLTQQPLTPDWQTPEWRVGFSNAAGGVVNLLALAQLRTEGRGTNKVGEQRGNYRISKTVIQQKEIPKLDAQLSATELSLFQQLANPELPLVAENAGDGFFQQPNWLSIEKVLRQYSQYHFGRLIRSAVLMDTYLTSLSTSS
ncbi:DNA repair protein RecO [Aerosakkonemataceae cyanobacterium BLCC-F154]|uniref:DNA repair protein RecO n=1 Tax=Floridaenema fluviatile BLCC-F154 TaxID=3153640 RepID=A0ABV4Y866_9CYAN